MRRSLGLNLQYTRLFLSFTNQRLVRIGGFFFLVIFSTNPMKGKVKEAS
jgi:hypothetical protein